MSLAYAKPMTLNAIGILEFLEHDPRPSFILEPSKLLDFKDGPLQPEVCNTALLTSNPLLGAIFKTDSGSVEEQPKSYTDFRAWLCNFNEADHPPKGSAPTFLYHNFCWTRVSVHRWTIISGLPLESTNVSNDDDDSNVSSAKRLKANAASDDECPKEVFEAKKTNLRRIALGNNQMGDDVESSNIEIIAPNADNFKRLAKVNPSGIFFASPIGEIHWANDAWYTITDHPRAQPQASVMDCSSETDLPLMKRKWHELSVMKTSVSFDVRLRKKWYHEPSKTWGLVWIHIDAVAVLTLDGSLKSVMGYIRDISAARKDQEDQITQLTLKTQQCLDSEKRFARIAHSAPYGVFCTNPQGVTVWVNDKYCEMTQQSTDLQKHYFKSGRRVAAPEFYGFLDEQLEKLMQRKQQVSFEYRTTIPCVSQFKEGTIDTHWYHCNAFPELNEDGSMNGIMGILTDISHMKAAESLHIQTLAAERAKKEQEDFMDITSHELRNPLSAILQSADSILTSLEEYRGVTPQSSETLNTLFESTIDSVQIIMLCAQHQGVIINDVLTLSKLDAGLLLVSPIPTQPLKTVQQVLKMFEAEISSYDIGLEFHVEDSYYVIDVDWVLVDPARLTQVFINLITNAIKFTKSEPHRQVAIRIGASKTRPRDEEIDHIEWFPTRSESPRRSNMLGHDWNEEGQIFLTFAVQDTGRGLSCEEKSRLFHRFSQANPRTHVEYGGSGLGLFISRELTERHGGQIGVKSVLGEGSTFAFYVKAQRTDQPTSESRKESDDRSSMASRKGSQPFHNMKATLQPPSAPRRTSETSRFTTSASQPAIPKLEVLLVEDNLVNQKVLSKQLLKAGCTVHLANHGQEALDQLRSSTLWSANNAIGIPLNVILMDVEMPVMNGMTAVRHIREMQASGEVIGHVPVIAVTANARPEQVEASLQGGMDDVMPKPFLMRELLPKMERLVAKSKEQQS